MASRKWFVIFLVIFVFSVSESIAKNKIECACDFDSPSYIADCDCGLSCSVVMGSGRECHITCDGRAKNISRGDSKIFGEPAAYKTQLNSYLDFMSKEGFRALNVQPSPEKAIMYLFRSGYIGTYFIPENTKVRIDQFVYGSFTEYWSKIEPAFFKSSKGEFNKTFGDGESLNVSYKQINLKISEYTIRLRILR